MIRFDKLLETCDTEYSSNSKNNKPVMKDLVPWIDKYRPKNINEIEYQYEVKKILESVLKNGSLPHLLFYGPSGIGKTSTILAMAKDLFGPKIFGDRVIELNASDERGINIVRNKIVKFAQTAIGNPDPNYPSPPYKIIILDEADAMTTDAQSALRKIVEDKSNITRFCFICNYIHQIIEPISSRCVKIRFKPINSECVVNLLTKISINEKMQIDPEAISKLATICHGDMRKSIMLLQNLNYLNKQITINDVLEISNYIPSSLIDEIIYYCFNNDANVSNILKLTKNIKAKSYPIYNILIELVNKIVSNDKLNDNQKSYIVLHMSKIEKRLIDGANEHMQLLSLLLYMMSLYKNQNVNDDIQHIAIEI